MISIYRAPSRFLITLAALALPAASLAQSAYSDLLGAPAVGAEAIAPAPEVPPAAARPAPKIDTGSVRAITALDEADMAAAAPEQRLAMLRTLIKRSNPAAGSAAEPDREQEEIEGAIYRLLASAPDAASFDGMYYHVRQYSLHNSVTSSREIRKLARRHLDSTVPGDWDGLARYIDVVTGSSSSGLNGVEFLIDSKVLPAASEAIDAAESSINIEVYQLQADEIGWALAKKLAAKAAAGVKVRLIVDNYGSGVAKNEEIRKLLAYLNENGAEARVRMSPRLTGSRDHRKVMVIDGKVGFTGGMNIGGHYQVEWHDQQSRITGPAVARLQDSFLGAWAESGEPVRDVSGLYPQLEEVPGGVELRVVYHRGNEDRNIKAMYLRAFHTAQRSIRVATPYFADPDIVDALCDAASRGVKVQLVFPGMNNKGIALRGSRAFYPQLIKAGVEIYEYQGRMAHQKVAVLDGVWSSFGSSNLDSRSLKNNHELNAVALDAGLAGQIERGLFDVDIPLSVRITSYKPSLMDRLAGRLYPWL